MQPNNNSIHYVKSKISFFFFAKMTLTNDQWQSCHCSNAGASDRRLSFVSFWKAATNNVFCPLICRTKEQSTDVHCHNEKLILYVTVRIVCHIRVAAHLGRLPNSSLTSLTSLNHLLELACRLQIMQIVLIINFEHWIVSSRVYF